MNSGKEVIYSAGGLPNTVLTVVQIVAVLSLAFTCLVAWKHWSGKTDPHWSCWFYVCWAWWVFLPPIWFSFEYFYLFKPHGAEGSFEAFKYGQELASRGWLGIAAALSFIATQ